jgi:hypothetical protein
MLRGRGAALPVIVLNALLAHGVSCFVVSPQSRAVNAGRRQGPLPARSRGHLLRPRAPKWGGAAGTCVLRARPCTRGVCGGCARCSKRSHTCVRHGAAAALRAAMSDGAGLEAPAGADVRTFTCYCGACSVTAAGDPVGGLGYMVYDLGLGLV